MTSTTSLVPEVIWTSTSSSPSSSLMPFTPVERTFEYSFSAVFLTVPCRVQKSRYSVSVNCFTGTIAFTSVSGVTLIRLTIGFPFVARAPSGISWTFSQKQRPSWVKTSR